MTAAAPTDRRRALANPLTWVPFGLLAAVTYVPLLLTKPGQVGADTKSYLYLDPGRLLRDAPFLWDPGIGLGTVTHQNIGYLWPMGPFYWALDTIGLPDWVAQRLWLASVMFAAGAGVLYLLRVLNWRAEPARGRWWDGGMVVAALAYALSPYVLDYAARISVILLPWAALPWLIALTIRALRHGGWRHPALFALVVLTVGSVNATSLILVGLGPLLWVGWAVWVEREVTWREALGAVLRIGFLTGLTSLWWMSGLTLQGAFGIPILRYTETYQAVAVTSMTPELLRGLGYWFFYGNDKLGQWIVPSISYMSWGLPVSYAIPILAFLSAVVTRFRHRAFFVALIAVGAVVGIGGHPFDDPSPVGGVFKRFTEVDAGLAFRSTARAGPLIVLGTSVLLGAGVSALGRALPRYAVPAAVAAVVLVVVNLPATWGGNMVDRNLDRAEDIPDHWHEATAYLDEQGHETRVLELPGTDFAAYRWGNTVDPVTPGLMDRPYVARELIPYGSHPSANLLNALDRPLQEDTFDPNALETMARLMAVGDVVLRSDLEYERFRTPRPRPTWQLINETPGLGDPVTFGEPEPNRAPPTLPMIDEVELGIDPNLPDPPPVAAFPVEDPLPIVRAVTTESPTLIAGDGDGLVAGAAAGLIDPSRLVLYSATMADDPEALQARIDDGADLVVTDSNRKRARRWGTVRENEGYTERAGEEPLVDDPSDNRLEVFPDGGDDEATVSVQRGGATVSATAYGNPVTYTPGDRAAYAMDGDPTTAWRVGAFAEVTGERLVIELDEPLTTNEIRLLQPRARTTNRFITDVRLRFDEGPDVEATLDETSYAGAGGGQTVTFAERTFSRVE
ncbi:MAG TPA: alpha-(1-_3)-arabinofuranosyltransferase family protein, partial [Acidimicrobiales bacterium]|nr:alpha-(1->3)-arabinofuranosyltransferase family protein [Acidimicrobiales bacterium]